MGVKGFWKDFKKDIVGAYDSASGWFYKNAARIVDKRPGILRRSGEYRKYQDYMNAIVDMRDGELKEIRRDVSELEEGLVFSEANQTEQAISLERTLHELNLLKGEVRKKGVEAVGTNRKVDELLRLAGHLKHELRRLRTGRRRNRRILYNETKPHNKAAILFADKSGKIYFHNRRAMRIVGGRFRDVNLGDNMDLDSSEKQLVEIHSEVYTAYSTSIVDGYSVVLKSAPISTAVTWLRSKGRRPNEKMMKNYAAVASAQAKAEEARLDKRYPKLEST